MNNLHISASLHFFFKLTLELFGRGVLWTSSPQPNPAPPMPEDATSLGATLFMLLYRTIILSVIVC